MSGIMPTVPKAPQPRAICASPHRFGCIIRKNRTSGQLLVTQDGARRGLRVARRTSVAMVVIQRSEPGGGFSVLDGAAIVTGAAVASIHIRRVIRDDLAAPGWVLIWGTFAWVALTAAGPFLF